MLSPSVRSLRFRMADGRPVGHEAGQYVDLVVPTRRGLPFRRSYSIASAPDPARADVFEVAVTRVEALRRSRLFDEVVMETGDMPEAQLGGFEYVLWEPAGKPLFWHYRSRRKGGDAIAFKSPGPAVSVQQWLEAVRDQLGGAPAS